MRNDSICAWLEPPKATLRHFEYIKNSVSVATSRASKSDRCPTLHRWALGENPPVVVTDNFGDASVSPHAKLMRIAFNVSTVTLSECGRVVLFNFTEEDVDEEDQSEGEGSK
jgi:hypothetical protein